MFVCFLDLKIYENPTHIGRVSAWSKTGAAIFILKIDVRKKLEKPPITNSIDSSKPSNSRSPWWDQRRRSWNTLHKSSAPAKQDWESLVCRIHVSSNSVFTFLQNLFKICYFYNHPVCSLHLYGRPLFRTNFLCSICTANLYLSIYHGTHSAP